MRAVIDLGSNTFHLLVARVDASNRLDEVYRERSFVHLAEGGIGHIIPAAFERGLQCLQHFHHVLKTHDVRHISAVGTAALRHASNAFDFVEAARQATGIDVQVIDGAREAQYIFEGVRRAVDLSAGDYLIMDIGGGSVEFIHTHHGKQQWLRSFPIGVAVLHRMFHHHEPITTNELQALESHIDATLTDLYQDLAGISIRGLIGASGSFEVVEKMQALPRMKRHAQHIAVSDFRAMYDRVINADYETRLAMENLPQERAKLIVVAFHLMDVLIRRAAVSEIIVSDYAMKEGILFDAPV